MEISREEALLIVNGFVEPVTAEKYLGEGKDGIVFATSIRTAVKLHYRSHTFENELAVYQRLAEHRASEVNGFMVPRLIAWDRPRRLIEMSWVRPPFVLDFAGSRIDQPFDFEPEVIEMWHEQRQEEYGERWPEVLRLIHAFERSYGIYLDDISPRNVRFENQVGG